MLVLTVGWVASFLAMFWLLGGEVGRVRRGEVSHEVLHRARAVLGEMSSKIAHGVLRFFARGVAFFLDSLWSPLVRLIRILWQKTTNRIFGRHPRPRGKASSFFLKYIAEERSGVAPDSSVDRDHQTVD